METTNQPQAEPKTKKRNPFVAFLLSLVIPGLGQIYNGQAKKAFWIFTIWALLFAIAGLTGILAYFLGFISFFTILLAYQVYGSIDAIINARRQKAYVLKSYNKGSYYLLIIIAWFGIWELKPDLIRSMLGVITYQIPTPSGEPTVLVGDHLVADMRAYKNKDPQCGDIVVFKMNDIEWFSRVIGVPGDKIEVKDDIATINGKPSKATLINDSVPDPNQTFAGGLKCQQYEEELPNGHKHYIYKLSVPADISKNLTSETSDGFFRKTNMQEATVPAGCYFILGDSRDNAMDSRYKGFIKRADILGRFVFIYWSRADGRVGKDLHKS